jgi:hypothetical protein
LLQTVMRAVVDPVHFPPLGPLNRFRNPRGGDPELPPRLGEGDPEPREEVRAVLPIGHDLPTRHPAEHDVVQGSGRIKARTTGHGGTAPLVDIFGNDPHHNGTVSRGYFSKRG